MQFDVVEAISTPVVGRTPIPVALADVSFVDARTAAAAAGISLSHFRDLVREGEAPQPLRFGPRCTRWRLAAVRQWLQQRATRGAADAASTALVLNRARKASAAAQVKRQATASRSQG
jgi:predicted DNA-binding transcriptional regulator AlpA